MNCFPCFSSQKTKESTSQKDHDVSDVEELQPQQSSVPETENKETPPPPPTTAPADYDNNSSIKAFNFRELASATKNFKQESLLGEGSLGKVYKGTIQGQDVAVKQLDRNAMEGSSEFFVEVGQLGLLQHANLVSLVGYCADGDQRLLVYEFMPGGSLQDHLHGDKQRLDWVTRMKIAHGTALGLQYLHEKAKPPVIYRDLKSSKVLLDDEFNPKLSNIGLDKLGPPTDSNMLVPSKIRENNGYNAPECVNSGTVNAHTDVYSFGVVLLEIISGRKALDTSKPEEEQMLVNWAQPIFKEPKYFPQMADPSMNKEFPEGGLNQAVAMAAMCVQEEAAARPLISDLASVLGFLSVANQGNNIPEDLSPSVSSKLKALSGKIQVSDDDDEEAWGNSNEDDERSDNESDNDDECGCSDASLTGSSNAEKSLDQKQSLKSDRSLSHRSSRRSSSLLGSSRKKSRSDSSCSDEEEESSRKGSDAPKGNPMKSVDETEDSPGKKSRKKSSDKKSKDRKSSKKKKKSEEENDSSRCKSGSTKKSRRKAKKHSDNDDDSLGGSQPEN
ncbi:Serine/threonine-protein kinase [Hibiscus syriacus]|uniref:Serine/threonine-protein kinase n=1 Tax=Hibiscus syriacus TaxID=106335 RepID=A0A6A2Y5H5_HIBSY|nr:Serine/threonine-protein kinase [Hibiscus syriacus]